MPGVQSILVLSKRDGAIISTTGLLSNLSPGSDTDALTPDFRRSTSSPEGLRPALIDMEGRAAYGNGRGQEKNSADNVARMVFQFVAATGHLVNGLDEGNEIQLLRLRTRKNEIVIVPGRPH